MENFRDQWVERAMAACAAETEKLAYRMIGDGQLFSHGWTIGTRIWWDDLTMHFASLYT